MTHQDDTIEPPVRGFGEPKAGGFSIFGITGGWVEEHLDSCLRRNDKMGGDGENKVGGFSMCGGLGVDFVCH